MSLRVERVTSVDQPFFEFVTSEQTYHIFNQIFQVKKNKILLC